MQPSEGVQDQHLPIEARLQREQQDVPTKTSAELMESPDELPASNSIDEPKEDNQQSLRRSTRQRKPVQRLMMEAMQAELQDQSIPGEIFSRFKSL